MAAKIIAYLNRYSAWTHTFLALWNVFVSSWATGLDMPINLAQYGIPYVLDINARDAVSYIQLHTHMPTAVIGILTMLVNGTMFYISWQKKHVHPIEPAAKTE